MGSIHVTQEQVDIIYSLYLSGMSASNVASKIGLDTSTVYRHLQKNDVPLRPTDITPKQLEVMRRLYQSDMTMSMVANEMGLHVATVQRHLSKSGDSHQHTTKYTHNNSYFSEPLNEHSAYWIGFILADGSVVKPKNASSRLRIMLDNKDIGHLEKFRYDIESNHLIHSYTYNRSYREGTRTICVIEIVSNTLCKSLVQYEIIPRKTGVHGTPQTIPPELMRHFYRGYVDGDGHIAWRSTSRLFQADGSVSFIKEFREWLIDTLDISSEFVRLRYKTDKMTIARVACGTKRNVPKIIRLLYGNCDIALDRKMVVAQRCIDDTS